MSEEKKVVPEVDTKTFEEHCATHVKFYVMIIAYAKAVEYFAQGGLSIGAIPLPIGLNPTYVADFTTVIDNQRKLQGFPEIVTEKK